MVESVQCGFLAAVAVFCMMEFVLIAQPRQNKLSRIVTVNRDRDARSFREVAATSFPKTAVAQGPFEPLIRTHVHRSGNGFILQTSACMPSGPQPM